MRHMTLYASVAALSLLAACGETSNGYYDSHGNWIAAPNATTQAQRLHSPLGYEQDDVYTNTGVTTTVTTYHYTKPGYYDSNGYYISDSGTMVPDELFPPRGMCRIWFPGRPVQNQPGVESCDGIRARVPAGAYVIYGG